MFLYKRAILTKSSNGNKLFSVRAHRESGNASQYVIFNDNLSEYLPDDSSESGYESQYVSVHVS